MQGAQPLLRDAAQMHMAVNGRVSRNRKPCTVAKECKAVFQQLIREHQI